MGIIEPPRGLPAPAITREKPPIHGGHPGGAGRKGKRHRWAVAHDAITRSGAPRWRCHYCAAARSATNWTTCKFAYRVGDSGPWSEEAPECKR